MPSIFDSHGGAGGGGGGLMFPVPMRKRPPSGLALDVKGLANADHTFFLPTRPRERPGVDIGPGGKKLSASDSTSDRIRRLHTSQCTRQEIGGDGRFSQRRNSQPAVLPLHAVREQPQQQHVPTAGVPAKLAPITRRLPSAAGRGGTLPPIAAEGVDSGITSHVTEEEEEESLFGAAMGEEGEGEEGTEFGSDESDSDDEVCCFAHVLYI